MLVLRNPNPHTSFLHLQSPFQSLPPPINNSLYLSPFHNPHLLFALKGQRNLNLLRLSFD